MNGYLKDDEATAACTTDDGFLTCGDIVIADDEGFIRIVDRKKDMIISGGVNVYPRDVEEALVTHPAIAEAAVIGVPDEKWGEIGRRLRHAPAATRPSTWRSSTPTCARCSPATRSRARSSSSTRSPATPAARCSSASCGTSTPRTA